MTLISKKKVVSSIGEHSTTNTTIASLATPEGIGGLAVIRISGSDA